MKTNFLDRLNINTDLATQILSGFIKDQIAKTRANGVILGLSGGIDSALSAYLSVQALGAENVFAVKMPYRTSSTNSLLDADAVIEALNLPHLTVDISPMADALINTFPTMDNLRRGNIMARCRMVVLYDQSAEHGLLPIGTSNKTEFLLGYTTIYGDSAVAMHPIADLYKYQVRQLSQALNIPASILNKSPSADLWEGQTDEEELGFTYDEVDQLLYLLVDERYTTEEAIAAGFDETFVKNVWRRVLRNHYKRTMPNIAKISYRTIGHDFLYLRDWAGE